MKNLRISNQRPRITALVFIVPVLIATSLWAGEIHTAAAAGDLNKVRALIEADPTLLESKDNDGNTPLIAACKTLQVAVANFLIDKGANVNAKGMLGGTPLLWMRKDKDESFDLVQRLIAKGADVNAANEYEWTVLCSVAFSGNTRVARLLIDHGADVNYRWTAGSLLQMAINLDANEEMAKLLVESGARPQGFSFGNTELHLAAMKGLSGLVPLLVKLGADVNAVNEYKRTALYYAAKHGHRQAADALIAAGANKSAIVETNYGKAPQLATTLKEGEAYLWYLGSCSPCDGYAVKTKTHLLIFNPSRIDESPEAGLANGHLNPNELAGQKIIVLTTHRPGPYDPSISELAKAFPGADLVLNFKPAAGNAGNSDIPPYRLAAPNESFSIGGIQVHTIPAMLRVFFESEGLGYLVDADGVKIFHPGLHVSGNGASQMVKYRKEIDFLKPFGPVDIAILPIKGRHISLAYEPYLYLLDQLSPKAVYLIGDDLVTDEHRKCVTVLQARNIPVAYPEGGIAMGERFHYRRPPSSHASFQGLGDFPGGTFESMALRVSADGTVVVGNGTTASGRQAFRWTQSQGMANLGNLPDSSFKQSWAEAVSSDGSVIVGYGAPSGSGWEGHKGFRWTQSGGMVETGHEAYDVSADGTVVVGDGGQQAFRWAQSGGVVGLGILPNRSNSRAIAVSADGSVVVGSSYDLPSWDKQEAFLWTQGGGMEGLGFLPGGNVSFPNAVSPEGSVIAGTASSSDGYAAFRWTRSTGMVSIGHLPGRRTTHPGGVSANGSIIVGGSYLDRDHATAFIWDAAHGMRSLQSVLETDCGLNLTGWNLQHASAITPDGSVIVGWGTNPAGHREAFRAVLGAR